jgi:hypothetical protein
MVPVVADDHGIFKEPLKHRSWELYWPKTTLRRYDCIRNISLVFKILILNHRHRC